MAGKKIKGKKRHILVDTLGLLLSAAVHSADIQDRDGAALVLDPRTRSLFPVIVPASLPDAGYQGARAALAASQSGQIGSSKSSNAMNCTSSSSLPENDGLSSAPSPGLNRCRRLAKDWENLNRKAHRVPLRLTHQSASWRCGENFLQSCMMFPDRL